MNTEYFIINGFNYIYDKLRLFILVFPFICLFLSYTILSDIIKEIYRNNISLLILFGWYIGMMCGISFSLYMYEKFKDK